jgi:predicted RND superfamily exporter protein
MSTSFSDRLAHWVVAWRWPLLVFGLALAAAAYVPSRKLQFDRSIENMFAADDPLLKPYAQLKRTFGGNEIVVAAYVDPKLTTAGGIARVDELTQALKAVDGVSSIVSLTTTPLRTAIVRDTPIAREFVRLFEDYTIGADRQTAAVVCMLTPEENLTEKSEARDRTIERLREIVHQHDPSGVLAGEPVMVVDGFRAIKEDGRRLGWISTGLLMLTIVLCFRSVRWMMVPLVIVNFALLVTEAALVLSGLRLSMVSSMLWAIITVVGIATVVHVIVRFRETRARGMSPAEALTASLAVLAVPVWWTCVTDATGFAALLAASVGPVKDFGIMMTVGTLLAMVGLAILLPGLVLAGRFDADPRVAWGERSLGAGLRRLLDWVLQRPLRVGLVSTVLVAAAALGCFRLEVETDFTKNFRQRSQIVQAYELVETNLRGAGVWDIVVPAPKELDHEFLQKLRELHARLSNDWIAGPGITKSLSLAQMVDAVPNEPKEWLALLPEGSSLADLTDIVPRELLLKLALGSATPMELTLVKLNATKKFMPEVYHTLHGQDPEQGRSFARVMLRSRERQSSREKHQLIERVKQISRELFPEASAAPPAEVTGYFVLLANLIDSLNRDQWLTFSVAAGAIWLMMLVAFRSVPVATATMVPNLLPIFLLTGVMGWSGLKINMGAAMIAAVSVGLSVDSSIHYVSAWRTRLRTGQSHLDVLHAVQQSVGRAATLSTLSLMVGFSALCLSEFVPIIYFGVLVSLAMLGGLVGNVVLLPLLLHWVTVARSQESGDRRQESGDRGQESGDRGQESGDRRQRETPRS